MRLELFNDKAHEIVAGIFDYSERKLAKQGVCAEADANAYLGLDYIQTCGTMIENSVQYLENDERLAADVFLAKLPKAEYRARFHRYARRCAVHLSSHATYYFPEYRKLLRLACLHVLSTSADWQAIRRSGVVMLASASLPNVRTDIRRELRRRGVDYEYTLVSDDVLAKRIGYGDALKLLG